MLEGLAKLLGLVTSAFFVFTMGGTNYFFMGFIMDLILLPTLSAVWCYIDRSKDRNTITFIFVGHLTTRNNFAFYRNRKRLVD